MEVGIGAGHHFVGFFLVAACRLTGVSVGSVLEKHSLSLMPQTELDEANTKCVRGFARQASMRCCKPTILLWI